MGYEDVTRALCEEVNLFFKQLFCKHKISERIPVRRMGAKMSTAYITKCCSCGKRGHIVVR